jgi:hypothetical protein
MKIGKRFNQLTLKEYFFYIENHKKYTDFNTLGLYRSIIENEKLNLEQKLELREFTHSFFKKFFDFLQLKDPKTYFDILTIGQILTDGEKSRIWEEIRINQKKILSEKKIKHRNFGTYAKHSCSNVNCYLNGLMIKQGSQFAYPSWGMNFNSDKNPFSGKQKSDKLKKESKKYKLNILKNLEYQ